MTMNISSKLRLLAVAFFSIIFSVGGQGCSNRCPPINFGTPVPSLCEGDVVSSAFATQKEYTVCDPEPASTLRFSDFAGEGRVTVISNTYIGCNAGRRESGVFAHVAQKFYNLYGDRTSFITSLKGGTTCGRWADIYQRDAVKLFPDSDVIPKEMPLTILDQEYEIRDEFFTAPFGHPSYVVLDGNLTVRHKFVGPCCGYEGYYDCTADIATELDTVLTFQINKILLESGEDIFNQNNRPIPNNSGASQSNKQEVVKEEEEEEAACSLIGTGAFSDWSDCSVFCGEGIQFSWRLLEGNGCPSPPVETRTQICYGRLCIQSLSGCVPEVGESWEIETVVSGLDGPRDVAFHPTPGLHLGKYSEGRPFNPDEGEEAWVVNGNNHSISIVASLGTSKQTTISRRDRGYYHYMINATALSFNTVKDSNRVPDRDGYNYWAVCNDNLNTYLDSKEANNFMGPTLYNSDSNNKNTVNRLGESCKEDEPCYFLHSDMLHESPGCIGIVHDPETVTQYGHVYWAFDATGDNTGIGQLVRFDFQQPHGPGSMDHSIAAVRRYPEVNLRRADLGVHAGMAIHPTRRELYISVPGDNHILVVNIDSGAYARTAREEYPIYSNRLPSFEYSIWECVEQRVFASNIDTPSGMAISPDGERLFVAEHETGKIHVYEIESGTLLKVITTGHKSIGGMDFSPKSKILHFVDEKSNTLNAVTPTKVCDTPIMKQTPEGFTAAFERASEAVKESSLSSGKNVDQGISVFSLYEKSICSVDPIVPDTVYFDQVHVDTGYASDNPDVQSMAGMDEAAALLAPRRDCGPTSELNFDALLLGGYYCHPCLPSGGADCDFGGKCSNSLWNGFTCNNEFMVYLKDRVQKFSWEKSNGESIDADFSSYIYQRSSLSLFSKAHSVFLHQNVTYRFTARGDNVQLCAHTDVLGASLPYKLPGNKEGCAINGPLIIPVTSDLPSQLYLHARLLSNPSITSVITAGIEFEGKTINFEMKKDPSYINEPRSAFKISRDRGGSNSNSNINAGGLRRLKED